MRLPAPAAYALSLAVHGAAFLAMSRVEAVRPPAGEDVKVEIVETAPPPPREEPPAPAPLPPPPRRAPRQTPLAPPPDAPPPRQAETPPPPNEQPPPEATPPGQRAPVRIGISMSSSTEGGGFAAPAGNTLYGQAPRTAPDPADVKPYRAERYAPPTQVTVLPKPIGECAPPSSEYPEEALRLGVEGVVILAVTIDETGAVADARVIQDPGHGLGRAAAAAYKKYCRFEPARRGSEAVGTTIRVPFRWEIP